MALFQGKTFASSFASHGAASGVGPWVAISAAAHVAFVTMVPAGQLATRPPRPTTIEFSTVEVEEPVAPQAIEPCVAEAVPRPRVTPRPQQVQPERAEVVRQSDAVTDATPAVVTESVAAGLPVAATVGAEPAAATVAGHPDGDPNANGTAVPAVDPAPFRRAYVVSINRLIPKPDVPRSLEDTTIDAVTVIGLTLDPSGHVVRVRVARSSGQSRFDALALEFYQSHAFALPAPPPESQWVTREIPLSIRWHN